MRGTEVHRCSFYFGDFSCRDGNFVYRGIKIRVDSDDVVFYGRSRIGNSCQIEETVVGKVHNSSFVGSGTIFYYQCIFLFFESVSHFYFQVAWESFFSVSRYVIENDCAFIDLIGIPDTCMKSSRTSVERIRAIIDG